jgi:hypothetical protein
MSDPVNVRDLAVGTRLLLVNGGEVEVVANPGDGVWLFVRRLPPEEPGEEDMIFAQDVAEIRA